MTDTPASSSPLRRVMSTTVGLVVAVLVLMWLIELIDAVVLSDRLERQGIQPRTVGGLDGVFWAPFLHDDLGHLLSNTVPFAILGWLVALGGRRRWVAVSVFITIVGGLATWLLARTGNHIGASGVVFGYLGYLVAAALVQRKLSAILIGVVAVVLYGGLIFGVLPQPGVSWEGHASGLGAGVIAALAVGRDQPVTT